MLNHCLAKMLYEWTRLKHLSVKASQEDAARLIPALKDYTWHCNRYTFASRLVMAGVDLRTVAELLGHRTLQMTLRYANLAADHKQSAVERLCENKSATKTATQKKQSGVAA